MKKMNSTELIEKADKAYENLEHDMPYDKSDFIMGYIKCYTELVNESNDIHNVVPFIGTAVFKKNNKGYSKIKNLTIGKMYGITKRHDRSKIRVYRPNMNDGFYITNDIGKEVVFTNMNMWDVYWV